MPDFRFDKTFGVARGSKAPLKPEDSVARGAAAPDVEQGE